MMPCNDHFVLLVFFMSTSAIIVKSSDHDCPESVNLRTTVAFANTSANFSCYDESAGEIPEIDLEVNGESVKKASLTGIEWEYINKEKNIGFKIVIAANLQTNNTELQCFLSPCVSNTASLIVVDELPEFSTPPSVVLLNSSSMNISWPPLWSYPVIAYTVTVTVDNGTLGQLQPLITNYTTSATYYNLHNSDLLLQKGNDSNDGGKAAGNDCILIGISVLADTDIGKTEDSLTTLAGFPSDFDSIDFASTQFTAIINYDGANSSQSYLEVSLKVPPSVCKYEELMYTLDIQSLNQSIFTKGYSSLSDNIIVKLDEFITNEGTHCLEHVHVNMSIANEIGQTRSWNIYNKNLLCLFQIQSQVQSSSIVISSNIMSSSSLTSSEMMFPQSTNDMNTSEVGLLGNRGFMIGVFTGAGVLLILICILSCVLGFFVCRHIRRSKKAKHISGSQGCMCEDFILPPMVNNENYDNVPSSESTAHLYDTVLYETIPPPQHRPHTFTTSPVRPQAQHDNITGPLNYSKLGEAVITPPPLSPDNYVEMNECSEHEEGMNGGIFIRDISPRYTAEPGNGGIN